MPCDYVEKKFVAEQPRGLKPDQISRPNFLSEKFWCSTVLKTCLLLAKDLQISRAHLDLKFWTRTSSSGASHELRPLELPMNLKAQSNKTPGNESLTDPITATNEVLAVLNLKQFTCQAKLLKAPFLI